MTQDEDKWSQWDDWQRQLHQIAKVDAPTPAYDKEAASSAGGRLEQIPYEWCALLHQAAHLLSPHVHAFYVCFYHPDTVKGKPLHFAYNFDDGRYDDPCWEALGTGPTSRVIRTGQPYVLTPQTRPQQHAGMNFGKTNHISHSAVHLPLRHWTSGGQNAPVVCGVFSAQSYTPGLWTRSSDPFVLNLQARADTAFAFWREQAAEAARQASENAGRAAQGAFQTRREAEARVWVQILFDVNKKLEAARALLPPGATAPGRALDEAAQFIHRHQTQISARQTIPVVPNASPFPPPVPPSPPAALTRREAEVWTLLRQNWSNAQIALSLGISERTVKFHCENIRKKTGQGRTRVFTEGEKPAS